MTTLQFDSCCCCINLRTGCLIIGYLSGIGSIIMMGLVAMVTTDGRPQDNEVLKDIPVGWTYAIIYIIFAAVYVILLLGIYKRKPTFVKVAWIAMIVEAVIDLIIFFVKTEKYGATGIISITIGTCLEIYWALCVRSYYLVLKEEDFRPVNQGGHV